MTPDQAREILRTVADSPSGIVSQFELFTALDALATVYAEADTKGMHAPQVAMHSPRATWASIRTHAEHRLPPAAVVGAR